MARPVRRKEVIRGIAADFGLKLSEVEEAVNSQFRFLASVMKSDTFDQVRIPYFGRFWVKSARLKFLEKFGKRFPEDEE